MQQLRRRAPAMLVLLPLVLMLLLFSLAPLGWIFASSVRTENGLTLARFYELLESDFYRQAFGNSLRLSLYSSVLGIGISLPAVASLRRVPGRLRDTVVAFVNMTGNLTGVPLAFACIIVLGTNGALTLILRQAGLVTGFDLYTWQGLVLIYTYFQIPLGVLLLYPALDALDDEWQQAAALLGAQPWQYWRHIGLPILMPAVAGTFILMFANAMGAYASAYALTQGNYNLLTIRIASLVAGDIFLEPETAAALSVLLTLLLVVVTLVQQTLLKRGRYGR